jgi:hypothetical protein
MLGQRGFWDVEERLKELSAEGDPLEKLDATVDFEIFRPVLSKALRRGDASKGGRPGFDPVLKFKMLVLQAMHGLSQVSRIHRKKPKGKPMPKAVARANATKSKVRARVEHVFAEQKDRMGLFIRTIGIARAEATIALTNMAFNMKRWCWLDRRSAPA